ncbi:MAG: ATP-binding protein [Candidatus Sedimenticola sp. PURPLELP]
MNVGIADVVIHIDEKLEPEQTDKLEQDFMARDGVVSADFNPDNPHLVVLKFDPAVINSRDLIDIPRYAGFHGELIGF